MTKMLFRGLLLTGLIVVAAPAFAQTGQLNPDRDFVATNKDAYLMLPPTLICGPKIKEFAWSGDGERLLILRDFTDITPEMAVEILTADRDRPDPTPFPEQQIISWNAKTRRTAVLYKLNEKDGVIRQADWMTGSSSVVVVATMIDGDSQDQPHTSLFLVSSNGVVKNVAPIQGQQEYLVEPSPYRPTAAFVEYPPFVPSKGDQPSPQEPPTVRFFGFDGALSQPVKFPSRRSMLYWSVDGRAYSLTYEKDPKTKVTKKVWAYANSSTHKFEPCDAPADSGSGAQDVLPEIAVVGLSAKASYKKLGISAPTIVATATDQSKDNDPGIVSTDGERPELSPKLNAVSYVSQESLMVRPMVKVPLDAYRKARLAALRTELLNKAKQTGLALIMYAGDYDDVLPNNKGNIGSMLEPYLKDSGIFDGFNYTFGGGNMNDIQSPAETQLGYFEGPGGRAVVFSDGHAKWIPNP